MHSNKLITEISPTPATERSRERSARRHLSRLGFRLEKTPARSWLREHFGPGYQILEGNTVVDGCLSREYEMTLEAVEAWIDNRGLN
ncbi:hypothetical protein Q9314_15210 [Shinella sumterensis]|nr:hypothetical protein Q9314_15210 [Shinella sumterensis]